MASAHGNRVQVSIVLDLSLEDRVHRLRGTGRNIRSFSAVAREALERGIAELERQSPEREAPVSAPVSAQGETACHEGAEVARTEGARLLDELLRARRQDDVAQELGVSQAMVSYWHIGRSRPTAENRALLEQLFGLPADAWDRPAQGAAA